MGQVFIEDYVVSFLKQKKLEAVEGPVRLALYGYAEKDNDSEQFIVYGAACEEEGRTVEETGQEFFPGYNFLGFVNVYNNEKENVSKYNIFFDENEAMQDYLLFYSTGNLSSLKRAAALFYDAEGRTSRRNQLKTIAKKQKNVDMPGAVWEKLKMILMGVMCVVLAVAISTIDDYPKMSDFTQTAEQVIVFIEETG